jgi:hypothetical protein
VSASAGHARSIAAITLSLKIEPDDIAFPVARRLHAHRKNIDKVRDGKPSTPISPFLPVRMRPIILHSPPGEAVT